MTALEKEILDVLVALKRLVDEANEARQKLPNLLPLLTRLEQLVRRLPESTNPRLRHYLKLHCYTAARLWLEGRHSEIQPCAPFPVNASPAPAIVEPSSARSVGR